MHPENPRYFADRSGKAILLTGSHTWPNLVDMGPSDPPPAFDFDAYLKWLRQHGHNFTRGWTWEPTKWDNTQMKNPDWRNGAHTVAPHPWPRTGPGLALDGKPKFDLEKHNPVYLDRIRQRLAQARDAGIYVSVMLFEGYGVQFQQNRRGKNQTLLESPADWISPNSDGGYRDDPPDVKGAKVVLSDTDHLWGIGGDAVWVWTTFTRGLNPIFMDTYDGKVLGEMRPQDDAPRKAMGAVLTMSRRIDLTRSTPYTGLSSTRYCLAEPSVSYVAFAPEGGDMVVDLTNVNERFQVEWQEPGTPKTTQGEHSHSSQNRSIHETHPHPPHRPAARPAGRAARGGSAAEEAQPPGHPRG